MLKTNATSELAEFRRHVQHGLSSTPKKLSSKYFYDDQGSRIFQKIMQIPEYYLTGAEREILQEQAKDIIEAINYNEKFHLVELGAGDGAKTKHLLNAMTAMDCSFDYIPIDISEQAISTLTRNLEEILPELNVQPVVGDYFQVLSNLVHDKRPNLLLFLGSNIGNFERPAAEEMLCKLQNILNNGDHLLIGFDLKKNPVVIRDAYFDHAGVTKSFNLNLLQRINREMDANFDLNQFDFYSYYDPMSGEVRSFIVSLCAQSVQIDGLGQSFQFQKNESIHTELSKKYSLGEIDELAQVSGFEIQQHYLDANGYFTDSLWKCHK